MALGDAGNYQSNNNAKRVFDPTFYSRIKIKNRDKLCTTFTFNKGLLKVEVSTEQDNYKLDKVIEINISPTKAKLLIAQLEKFIERMKSGEEIDPNEGVGINTGVSDKVTFIAFKTTGNRTDVPEHEFVIGKVSPTGSIEDVVSFVFNVDYDYALNWSNVTNMDVTKEIDQFMGIKTFLDVLKEFAYTSSGATGAAVWDTGRYETNRIIRYMNPIYEKLGIEIKNNSNRNNNGGGNNFFERQSPSNGAGRSNSTSLDDLENLLN